MSLLPVWSKFGWTVLSASVKRMRPILIRRSVIPSKNPYFLPVHEPNFTMVL